MKGTVFFAYRNFIEENFGQQKWLEILKEIGKDENFIIILTDDYDDSLLKEFINASVKVLKLSLKDIINKFAQYWINRYVPTVYYELFNRYKDFYSFVLNLNKIHQQLTLHLPRAKPPKFELTKLSKNTLVLTYKSDRNLIDFAVANLKALADYFNVNPQITKIGSNKILIDLAS